ncbi:type I-B CRISPR-associated protein Cas5b [Peptoniphilus sp. MSJ-1]|uniref:Type I-B CRISPR-associated protein Cas5b n=1 Tax=Peptoniphilus ovalis TaxID=2841503 RepID=A0ABS6FG34_9FIRM|nr:type I-B CRISPR-associated protein Cas5b [Peptoniphilus ovalis]MBU5668428.1 type I-B CRISPR-associated protein Cas5b [Peptoniphilus ovalis]
MKALKFNLSGKTAFFKMPDVNTYLYYSYGQIHRVALLGLIGAIMGYKGYADKNRKEYPEFYEKLKNIKISIVPKTNDGTFPRKLQKFNNSTGHASNEAGGNLIVKQVWLEDVSWDIYIIIDDEISESIADKILNNRATFIPYLGSNDHLANIKDQEIVELKNKQSIGEIRINSLFINNNISEMESFMCYIYREKLPFKLEKETERYIYEDFIFTNADITFEEDMNNIVFSHEEDNLIFYNEDGIYEN